MREPSDALDDFGRVSTLHRRGLAAGGQVLEDKIEWLVEPPRLCSWSEGAAEAIEVDVLEAAGMLDGVAAGKPQVVHEPADAAAGRPGQADVVWVELAEHAGW